MRIKELKYKNFKGLKDFAFNLNYRNMDVYGDNATGKSSLYDGFLWLLFDRDSLNQTNFEIKPIDPVTGETIHGIETEVSALIEHNSKEISLRKVYYEKWTKERGKADKVFSGHTTDYYIDDVPVKMSEYDNRIKELAKEQVFKLLTNPLYFNEVMSWTDRRNLLLSVCGSVDDETIYRADERLLELKEILKQRSIEDHRKVLGSKKKDLNEKIDNIPIRIDELTRGLPNLSGMDFALLEAQIDTYRAEQARVMKCVNDTKNGAQASHLGQELAEIETALIKLRNRYEVIKNTTVKDALQKENELLSEKTRLEYAKKNAAVKIGSLKSDLADIDEELQRLRDDWTMENSREFVAPAQADTCPTCGQSIPEEQIEDARNKALKEFNRQKSIKLEKITARGKDELSPKKNSFKALLEQAQTELNTISNEFLPATETAYLQAKEAAQALIASVPDMSADVEFIAASERKAEIRKQIEQLSNDQNARISELKAEYDRIDKDLITVMQQFSVRGQHEKTLLRIDELKTEERKLAAELENIDKQIYLAELYTKTMVDLLDQKINSRFEFARFKLFETQINGSLKDCCVTTYNSVPYGSLNNARRVQIGLDIIKTLSEHYGIDMPCFLDNRESIVRIPEMKCQIISLYVSEPDKKLRIQED